MEDAAKRDFLVGFCEIHAAHRSSLSEASLLQQAASAVAVAELVYSGRWQDRDMITWGWEAGRIDAKEKSTTNHPSAQM